MEVNRVERAAFFGGGGERCACPKRHGQNKMIKSEVFYALLLFFPCVFLLLMNEPLCAGFFMRKEKRDRVQ